MVDNISDRKEFEPRQAREAEVIGTIKTIETPFMESLKRVYGKERGWRMCGPASIALSRILSEKTGVPIGRDLPGEHIELEVGIYDPKDKPDRHQRMEEQTYVRYYTGEGNVYYIDPIYGLLMGGKQEFGGAIQVEKYTEEELNKALAEKHHLYPFDPKHEGLNSMEGHSFLANIKDAQALTTFYEDSVSALNDERATLSDFVADSGHTMTTDWNKSEEIIKEFVPGWQGNLVAKVERMQEVMAILLGQHKDGMRSRGIRIDGGMQTISLSERTELEYRDQSPRLENWSIDKNKPEPVLTFHVNNERYIVKEGEGLNIYRNGVGQKITEHQIKLLEDAIQASDDQKLIDFLKRNITS